MTGLDLEAAVVGPEVDRVGYTCNASFIYLCSSADAPQFNWVMRDHFSSLGPSNRELQIRIFLPVSKEKRKLGEETIVDLARSCDGLRARVAIESTL